MRFRLISFIDADFMLSAFTSSNNHDRSGVSMVEQAEFIRRRGEGRKVLESKNDPIIYMYSIA